MKRWVYGITIVLSILLLCTCLYAAGGKEEKGELSFVLVPKGVHPWYEPAGEGFKYAAEEIGGINARVVAPAEWSGEAQVKVVEDLVSEGVDAIATDVYDVGAMVPAINEVADQGIPILTFDAPAYDSKAAIFIGTDNIDAGNVQSTAFVEQMGRKGKYVVFVQDLAGLDIKQRVEGNRMITKKYPGMVEPVDVQNTQYDMSLALQLAENLLTAHPDLKGAVDMGMDGCTAMYKVFKERGVASGEVKVIGWTVLPDVAQGIREGYITGSIRQNPYAMGYLSCYGLKFLMEGKKPDTNRFFTGVTLVTKDNLDTIEEINKQKAIDMLDAFKKIWR